MNTKIKIFTIHTRFTENILADYLHANMSSKINLWNCSRSFVSFFSASTNKSLLKILFISQNVHMNVNLIAFIFSFYGWHCLPLKLLANEFEQIFHIEMFSICCSVFLLNAMRSWAIRRNGLRLGFLFPFASSRSLLFLASFPKECFVCIHLNIYIRMFHIYSSMKKSVEKHLLTSTIFV